MENTTVNKDMINKMFEAGAHYGYSRSRRHPSTAPFIFGVKNKTEIFDLEKTESALERAKDFMKVLSMGGKKVLFVGGKSEAKNIIENEASSINMPFVAGRWIGGTLTNFPEIRKRVEKLQKLSDEKEKGLLTKYTKKERLLIDREMDELRDSFAGLSVMQDLPAALFVVDPKKESIAIAEAKQMNIPVIALLNSDCNLKEVAYPVPGNDSSKTSIEFFVKEIVSAYRDAK